MHNTVDALISSRSSCAFIVHTKRVASLGTRIPMTAVGARPSCTTLACVTTTSRNEFRMVSAAHTVSGRVSSSALIAQKTATIFTCVAPVARIALTNLDMVFICFRSVWDALYAVFRSFAGATIAHSCTCGIPKAYSNQEQTNLP